MKDFSKKADIAFNISVSVVAVLLSVVLVKTYLLHPSQAAMAREAGKHIVGKTLTVEGVDWTKQPKTVVLALSLTCKFCAESEPFYQRLTRYAADHSIQMIALYPPYQKRDDVSRHLQLAKIGPIDIVSLDGLAIESTSTPTLVIVDRSGKVQGAWVGLLDAAGEREVMKQL